MQTLSVLSGVVFVIGFIPYIRAILRAETKPAKATWMIWTMLNLIMIAGMYAKNALNGQIVGITIGAMIVAILGLMYGKPGWSWLDKFCLGGAALAVILWQTFDSPTTGIVTSCAASLVGAIPTFVNAYERPQDENKVAWTLYWVSCVMAVFATPSWSLVDAAQPLTFFTIESIVMALLFIKPSLTSSV